MDIDFSLVLVCLVAGCGVIWILDSLLVKGGRIKSAEAFEARARASAHRIREILFPSLAVRANATVIFVRALSSADRIDDSNH